LLVEGEQAVDIVSSRGSGDRGSSIAVQKIEASRWTRNRTGVRTNNIQEVSKVLPNEVYVREITQGQKVCLKRSKQRITKEKI
jgi:hypothetical protein